MSFASTSKTLYTEDVFLSAFDFFFVSANDKQTGIDNEASK